MEKVNISRRHFNSLKRMPLPPGIPNTEGKLFLFYHNNELELLKYFYINEGAYFDKKTLNINTLMEIKDLINIPDIVLPTRLAMVDNHTIGYTMPYYAYNTNLSIILSSPNYSYKEKIGYLKDIGEILHKLAKIKSLPYHFHIGDLHEGNFIVDNKTNKLLVTDVDSFYISNNTPFVSKYLFLNPNISSFYNKYPEDDNFYSIPNTNSDILCYIMVILNALSRTNINNLTVDKFYLYLDYLSTIGYSKEIIESFYKIYTDANNINPLPYLDEINEKMYYQSHNLAFEKRTGVKLI